MMCSIWGYNCAATDFSVSPIVWAELKETVMIETFRIEEDEGVREVSLPAEGRKTFFGKRG